MIRLYGYSDFGDFVMSAVGLKYAKLHLLASILSLVVEYFTHFFTLHLETLLVLYTLMLADLTTGVVKAMRKKVFNSRRFGRIWILFIFNSFLLYISWAMSQSNAIFYYLPSIISGGLFSVNLISIIENGAELGWFNKGLSNLIKRRFGFKVLQNWGEEGGEGNGGNR